MAKLLSIIGMAALIVSAGVGCEDNDTQPMTTTTSSTSADGYKSPNPYQPTSLLAQARPPISDLPVPVGFEMIEDISRSYESSGARFVDHSFKGKADKYDVERFCRIQLPTKGWTMRGSQMVRGTFTMRYEKGAEYLEVRIWSDESWVNDKTILQYNVQTLGRGETKPYADRYK